VISPHFYNLTYRQLLLRHTDDYLFITPEYAEAKDFLDAMDKGHPEYGCFVSKEKTVVNFICDQVDNIAEHGTLGRLTGDKWLTTPIQRCLGVAT